MRAYAQQLSEGEVRRLAAATPGASGRDLRDIAARTERAWAAKVAHTPFPGTPCEQSSGTPSQEGYMMERFQGYPPTWVGATRHPKQSA